MSFEHFFTSQMGVRHGITDNNDGTFVICSTADCTDYVDTLKDRFNSWDRTQDTPIGRFMGSVPAIIYLKWMAEEGWNPFDVTSHEDAILKKLNDPDYAAFRTAPGHIAHHAWV